MYIKEKKEKNVFWFVKKKNEFLTGSLFTNEPLVEWGKLFI